MLLGLFADVHDHLDNLRRVVELFNAQEVETVLFAGDLVSTFAVPPLRKLKCPFVGCYGDNEGNKPGLQAGFGIIGKLAEAPVRWTSPDGVRFVLVHMERQLRELPAGVEFDVAVVGHTHKPRIERDEQGRMFLNPGEVSGWTFRRPTVMLFDTATCAARIVPLSSDGPDDATPAEAIAAHDAG
ncbi:MAG: YfcE family phosphodiesterase [Planctomycetaceae bacterium]|nr:YfcE family phosphodiesterase [Planctomycetaceae bacterium]